MGFFVRGEGMKFKCVSVDLFVNVGHMLGEVNLEEILGAESLS